VLTYTGSHDGTAYPNTLKILVTGAGGLLAGAVVRAARSKNHDVCPLDRDDLEVTDGPEVERRIAEERPEVVVHCAAYTAVDRAEGEADLAMRINRDGTHHVALAAAQVGVTVLYPSTDYVFDGSSHRPYRPDDEPGPLSAYGRSKLEGERALASAGGRWAVVRTSWLYGEDGPDFVDVILGASGRSDPMTIVDDQVGCPTWTGSLAPALIELAEKGVLGTLHLCDRGEASWLDLAREVATLAGIEVEMTATTTETWGAAAERPRYSVLDCSETEHRMGRTIPAWRASLRTYLEKVR